MLCHLFRFRSWGRWGWWPSRCPRSWAELGWIIWRTVWRWRRSAEAAPARESLSPWTTWVRVPSVERMDPGWCCVGVFLFCFFLLFCDSARSRSTSDRFWSLAQKNRNGSGSHRSPPERRWAASPSVSQVNTCNASHMLSFIYKYSVTVCKKIFFKVSVLYFSSLCLKSTTWTFSLQFQNMLITDHFYFA